jgi:alpha-1,2-mannosyltransferase
MSFAAATAAGFALAWHDSVRYWTSAVFQTDRVGNPATAANQCIQAVLARAGLDPHSLPGAAAWLALSVLVVIVACRGMRPAHPAKSADRAAPIPVTDLPAEALTSYEVTGSAMR